MNAPADDAELDRLTQEIKRLLVSSCAIEDTVPEDIGDDTPLFGDQGLGLDSLDAVEIVVMLQRQYSVDVKDMQRGQLVFRSPRTIAQYVLENRPPPKG